MISKREVMGFPFFAIFREKKGSAYIQILTELREYFQYDRPIPVDTS